MTKRQLTKLHELRRALIAQSWQTRQAKHFGNKDVETEASLEREITLRSIQNAKRGNS